jgi:hypothetical protein
LPLTIEVKSTDDAVRARRKGLAQSVVNQFGQNLPDSKLLAFFDDQDPPEIRRELGSVNRGLFAAKPSEFIDLWPYYVKDRIFTTDHSWSLKQVFDQVIYLYGSTCADEVGLVMTFSHELQHFVQFGCNRKLWAENFLTTRLAPEVYELEHLNWPDIPHEREARIVAKRVATAICGADKVDAYIGRRIMESPDVQNSEDWQFSRSVDTSVPYDLAEGTKLIFRRLKPYRNQLESVLAAMRRDASFKDIDLAKYF